MSDGEKIGGYWGECTIISSLLRYMVSMDRHSLQPPCILLVYLIKLAISRICILPDVEGFRC
eukprot:9290300-Karenia_brevis.AAC.1